MRRLPPVDPIGLSAVTLAFGMMIVVPFAWVTEGAPPLPDSKTLFYLAVLGLLPTAGANLLRVLVIRSAGPVFMSLTNYQVPIWSVLLSVVVLHPSKPTINANQPSQQANHQCKPTIYAQAVHDANMFILSFIRI